MVQVFPEQTDDGAAADRGTAGGTTVGGDTSDVTPGDADEAAEAAEAVRVVARRLRRAARADLEPLGVTAAQVRARRHTRAYRTPPAAPPRSAPTHVIQEPQPARIPSGINATRASPTTITIGQTPSTNLLSRSS